MSDVVTTKTPRVKKTLEEKKAARRARAYARRLRRRAEKLGVTEAEVVEARNQAKENAKKRREEKATKTAEVAA